jgi:hypothetical protein
MIIKGDRNLKLLFMFVGFRRNRIWLVGFVKVNHYVQGEELVEGSEPHAKFYDVHDNGASRTQQRRS